MKFTVRKGDGPFWQLAKRAILVFKSQEERERIKKQDEPSFEILTKRNAMILIFIGVWVAFYGTFQYNFTETPHYYYGPLFTIEPTLLLQQYRHIALDYFFAYFYMFGLIGMYILFTAMAAASEKNMWKLMLAFLACWIMQFSIQITVGAASPVRLPDTEVVFIRNEVFGASEHAMGIIYGAIPSGHIGGPIILFLSSKIRGVKWLQWVAAAVFIIFVYSLVYLGEHFIIDMVISLLIYPPMFLGMLALADKLDKGGDPLLKAGAIWRSGK